ncbi:MAG: hypothetical protein NTW82_08875 [Bacteroidia bacterium]|nr:hypothetical protein [Bacteroidia bacterium]
MKRILIIQLLILLILVPVSAQTGQQDLKREVTLYNPYKPSLSPAKKRSFFPNMEDTTRLNPGFKYDITIKPFMPEYTISPIKAASLVPDPLPKLYKSWVKIGFGNYITPLAEVSISNERSKKGAVGFYARHFSTNGKVKLQNEEKVYAGYMDNDASLYGRKFFRYNYLEGSVDYSQRVRYAYGYDTSIAGYETPANKDIKLGYNNIGADISVASLTLDSAKFSYDFDADYDFFFSASERYQHHAGLTGTMATLYKGFYAGSGIDFDFYRPANDIFDGSKFIVALSPFIKKSTQQWNFKAGIQLLLDKDTTASPKFYFYPDVLFGFSVVPEYVSFFAGLNGKLEINEPQSVIEENPFVYDFWGTLFLLKNTSHQLIVSAGLKGNTGIGGNYLVSASYSFINDMLFFSNLLSPGLIPPGPQMGNYFIPLTDDGELLKIHGEMNGIINDEFTYSGSANWYNYTLTNQEYPWNKPGWDGQIGLKYNLRDKIIAGIGVTALGRRNNVVSNVNMLIGTTLIKFEEPVHVNFNINAEYRFTNILSFWLRLNNISFNRYNEWAYYPSQRFIGLVGFTYSL